MKIKTVHPEEYKVAVKLQNLYLKTLILLKTTSIIKNKEMNTSYPIEYKTKNEDKVARLTKQEVENLVKNIGKVSRSYIKNILNVNLRTKDMYWEDKERELARIMSKIKNL